MKSTTSDCTLSGHCQKHQNHSERKPGTAYTPKWIKMPTLASSYHCNIYFIVDLQNITKSERQSFCIKLTPGRGRASKLFHVGSYLTESETVREETVITKNAIEFNALFFLIFLLHLVNWLLWIISGFLICYAISVWSTVSEYRWERQGEKSLFVHHNTLRSDTMG